MDAPPVIQVRDFRMAFGDTTVIDNLSFEVRRGETFGLLGSNGSGKTTTIRALLGIYTPTAGRLLIEGQPYDPARTASLGYLPEERGLYRKERVLEVMTYFGQLKGMKRTEAALWSMYFLERVGLADKAKVRIDRLSGGQQQKVQLGVTIMNNPEVLILDEPANGLDPQGIRWMRELLRHTADAGASVLLSSHLLHEVGLIADQLIVIGRGRILAEGAASDLLAQGDLESLFFAATADTSRERLAS